MNNSRLVYASQLRFREELSSGNFHRHRNSQNDKHSGALDASFDAAHVRSINAAAMGKLFLRNAALLTNSSNSFAKR
jgi:hypothetical protein